MKLMGIKAVLGAAAIAGLAMASPSFADSINFNTASTDYTGNFFSHDGGTITGATGLTADTSAWSSSAGVQDQPGPAAGGGVTATAGTGVSGSGSFQTDVTALYSPGAGTAAGEQLFSANDGNAQTISAYVKFAGTTSANDKPLQIGFAPQGTTGFNTGNSSGNGSPGPTYFITARIVANGTAQTQIGNGGTVASGTSSTLTGVTAGDWLKLTFTMTSTGTPGFFNGSFGVQDYGASGIGTPTTALATTNFTNLGNANLAGNLVAGFRMNETTSASTESVDNFVVTGDEVPEPATLGVLSLGALGLLARRRRA